MKILAPIAAAVWVVTCASPASVSAATAKHAELSKVISGLMTADGQAAASYEDLRKTVADVRLPNAADFSAKYRAVWSPHYQGSLGLAIHGKPYGADPMTQEDLWHVEIDGANEFPSAVQFTPTNATTDAGDATYFSKSGFTLTERACESLDAGNYAKLFTIAYPGKKPAYLEIAVSTGTAGTFVSYTFFWRAPESAMLPEAMKPEGCSSQPKV